MSAEVPHALLSPDLRQRVRHALAGHADLALVAAAVVRELFDRGLFHAAGTVRDGHERVPVYSLSTSHRVYDLRSLLEMPQAAEAAGTVPMAPRPLPVGVLEPLVPETLAPREPMPPQPPRTEPAASGAPELQPEPAKEKPEVEGPRLGDTVRRARVISGPVSEPANGAALSALEAIRRTFERDWISFGIEASLEALLEQLGEKLGDPNLGLVIWSEESGLREGEGRGWSLVPEDQPESSKLRRALEQGPVHPGMHDSRRWLGVYLLDSMVGALGTSEEVSLRLAQGSVRTIEELLLAFRRSQQRVHSDPLTGLHNRGFFEHQLSIELERSLRLHQPLALLFADIDHFKAVNDNNGHEIGDLMLQHVSRLMVQHLRRIDQVFRWGGEEFALLLPGTAAEEAEYTADRLRSVVESTPLQLPEGRNLSCTISIGIALAPQHALGGEKALLRHADTALYSAKEGGRNRVVMFED